MQFLGVFIVLWFRCLECYSEASDHEETESTEIPPPPYSEQTLRNSLDAAAPLGSTHQVSHVSALQSTLHHQSQLWARDIYWIMEQLDWRQQVWTLLLTRKSYVKPHIYFLPNIIKLVFWRHKARLKLIITSDSGVFVFQGTLPPPYSSTVPSEVNGSLSSPVSTMTSQGSASSLSKHRQSWLDLVSQASPPAGETAVVCSVQVHTHQPPQEETEEEEEEDSPVLEVSAPQDSSEAGGSEESPAVEEEEAQRDAVGAQVGGETLWERVSLWF